ncbi:MAG: tetratricopeptide repeat protein [Deltaproteobacteria bacterium]|nr:tetratricopeptide repeat protein [Deltaproteobacteria bacterium]
MMPPSRIPLCVLLACAPVPALGAPAPRAVDVPLAQAGPTGRALEQAQAQLDAGEFDEAVRTLQGALGEPDLTDAQLVELYRLLGLAQLYLGNEDRAREAYEKLLQARPDYELPRGAPPKVARLYERIREDIRKQRVRPVKLELEPLQDAEGGNPVELTVQVENLALGSRPTLYYRRAGTETFGSAGFKRVPDAPELYRVTVPAWELPAEKARYEVEYYVEVADAARRRLAGRGDAFNPLRFSVRPPGMAGREDDEEGRWYANPWVWVGIGAGVAAAGAGVALLLGQQQTGTATLTVRVQ